MSIGGLAFSGAVLVKTKQSAVLVIEWRLAFRIGTDEKHGTSRVSASSLPTFHGRELRVDHKLLHFLRARVPASQWLF